MKKLIILILLGCSMTSFALFDKIKKEIKWKEEEQPRFKPVKVMIDGEEKMRKVIPGRYEIKLFEITYPTDLFGKNRFYNEFNTFLKNIKAGKKYSLLLENRFYQEMQDIKVDQLSEEEKILELPASSLDDYYKQQIVAMSGGANLKEYIGTDQEYLNRQIFVLYELLNKLDFNPSNVYSELDKEFLIEELRNLRKEVVENFEKSNVEFFIKESYENSGLNKFKDDSVYKFDKDIVLSDKIEDQAVLPELQRNIYLTGFPDEIIEKLAKNQLKLKKTPLLLENNEYRGYTYNEDNVVVFIGGENPKYYYKDYKINVVKKHIAVLDLLKTSSNYYVSDFF
ncbi:hypothetical protein [Leptotrichia buccalis]|uniref:Uncharacterized protein n=1 Tax=Leptotrichia buccalis (strain ATCC 14201 / DSM 1135 / JCM 12969 / NCTC 10249 / C-1013-b) TaxID=523794 RepID=C7N8N2_LEPBD|nr:hypothetical protein [Leptotrichia buccalis]ACV38513.1 hypothetical protein Lebu_0605 [Leptotrichia buccalis C-1013-b]